MKEQFPRFSGTRTSRFNENSQSQSLFNSDLRTTVVNYSIGVGLLFFLIGTVEWGIIVKQSVSSPEQEQYEVYDTTAENENDPVQKALVSLERNILVANKKLVVLKTEFRDLPDLGALRSKVDKVMHGNGVVHQNDENPHADLESVKADPQRSETVVKAAVHLPPREQLDSKAYSFVRGLESAATDECSSHNAHASLSVEKLYNDNQFKDPDGGAWKQGFEISYDKSQWTDEDPLEVWVIPHSHNDPGWIKTMDEYFNKQTRNILSNMISLLDEDPDRTFIWAEISYFSMWWDTVDDTMKAKVRKVIKSGQFEIVGGGWVMPDEANTHYFAIIDQLMEGHQFLEKELGVKPKIGWAIDPFGHSPTMAYIMKRSGYEGMLIQRTHYEMKRVLAEKKSLEFNWRQDWDSTNTTDMFTHMMPFYSYDVPHTCGPDPSVCCQFDFARLQGVASYRCPWKKAPKVIDSNNVQVRSELILDQYRKKAQLYRTNSVLIPLGDDFRYDTMKEARAQFDNYKRIMDFINSHPEYKTRMRFGTLSDYYQSAFKFAKKKNPTDVAAADARGVPPGFPALSGDFFTYADRKDNYWSGYYTTRPFYKHFDRELEAGIRSSEIMFSLGPKHEASEFTKLRDNRRELGVFQHHDGMTGTAKDKVVVDYGNRMLRAISGSQGVTVSSLKALLGDSADPVVESSRKAHNSLPEREVIHVTSDGHSVVVHNSLAQPRTQYTSVICQTSAVKVTDADGHVVAAQAVPVWDSTNVEVWFEANVPALGFAVYTVSSSSSDAEKAQLSTVDFRNVLIEHAVNEVFPAREVKTGDVCVTTTTQTVCFNGNTGMLKSVGKADGSGATKMELQFIHYGSQSGKGGKDASGAYLFMPDGPAKQRDSQHPHEIKIAEGKHLVEIRVTDSASMGKLTHVVRVFKNGAVSSSSISISNYVDLTGVGQNLEVAMRLVTDVKHGRRFHTDLNGFQMRQRETLDKIPTQGNFFPMPSMAILEDDESRLTVNTRSALGCAALENGWFEVILDRRLQQDDNRGLFQKIIDNLQTESNFELVFERKTASSARRDGTASLLGIWANDYLNYPLYKYISKGPAPTMTKHDPVGSAIPCDVHVLNLRSLDQQSTELALLLHRRAVSCMSFEPALKCDTEMASDGMDLMKTFSGLNLKSAEAYSLTMMHSVASDKATNAVVKLTPREIYAWKLHRN